jgi:uncharacterized protein (TIGR00369 family)
MARREDHLSDAARSRTYTWEDPMPSAEAGRSMSGIEYLRAIRDGRIPAPPFALTLDMRLVAVEEGHALFECEPAEYHYNPIGVVHGGLAATLLDSAMGCAVQSLLPAGTGYTTLEIKVNFVRALTSTTGTVRAEGWIVNQGRRVAVAEARITDAAGKLYAHGTTTCLILPSEP